MIYNNDKIRPNGVDDFYLERYPTVELHVHAIYLKVNIDGTRSISSPQSGLDMLLDRNRLQSIEWHHVQALRSTEKVVVTTLSLLKNIINAPNTM